MQQVDDLRMDDAEHVQARANAPLRRAGANVQVGDPVVSGPGNEGAIRAAQMEGVTNHFRAFLSEFSKSDDDGHPSSIAQSHSSVSGSGGVREVYVLQAQAMITSAFTTFPVDFRDLVAHTPTLAADIEANYYAFKDAIDFGLNQFLAEIAGDQQLLDSYYVGFFNVGLPRSIREHRTESIGRLSVLSGVVTRTSTVRPELRQGTFRCNDCSSMISNIAQEFQFQYPTSCPNPTCANRVDWSLIHRHSIFGDWQLIRLQETSQQIPEGSMPRTIKVVLRNQLVELAKPGDKIEICGTLIAVPDVGQLSNRRGGGRSRGGASVNSINANRGDSINAVSGIKELGVRDLTYSLVFLASFVQGSNSSFGNIVNSSSDSEDQFSFASRNLINEADRRTFSEEEHAKILALRSSRGFMYQILANSIAPNIMGNNDIKRGVLLMLLGGIPKKTADGQKLRGDINVCVVGDPSTSKSQFLKFVCKFLPRAVYTSGKASSAAGLTASVVRDPETGEFAIEAGALMLADNGVCCIDEFDKMDPNDQVAIHEAMEQQTISVSKAGIQATLNARTSVLAAANPIHGRYDTSRTLRQNVDISPPIMSRFDLFFVLLDKADSVADSGIAQHIINCHLGNVNPTQDSNQFSLQDLQLYIAYARTFRPKLTPEACTHLVQTYATNRAEDSYGSSSNSSGRSAAIVTVRHLESLIRLSEARAKLDLSDSVRVEHVKEAARLLRASFVSNDEDFNVDDANFGPSSNDDNDGGSDGPSSGPAATSKSAFVAPVSSIAPPASISTAPTAIPFAADKGSKSLKIKAQDFARITGLLVGFARDQEELALLQMRARTSKDTSAAIPTDIGYDDLKSAYLISSSLNPVEASNPAVIEASRLFNSVLTHLISNEHVFLVTQTRPRRLKVHPNYTGDLKLFRSRRQADRLEAVDETEVAKANANLLEEEATVAETFKQTEQALRPESAQPASRTTSPRKRKTLDPESTETEALKSPSKRARKE